MAWRLDLRCRDSCNSRSSSVKEKGKCSAGKSGSHPGEVLGVSQEDRPLFGDAVAVVELHQLVQGGEELVPHVVLTAAVLEHLEMLDVVPVAVKIEEKDEVNSRKSIASDGQLHTKQIAPLLLSFLFFSFLFF